MMDMDYVKPLQLMDISNQRLAEQLTYKDAVSIGQFSRFDKGSLQSQILQTNR